MQYIEDQFIEQIKQQFNITLYGRYVDDIIIVYNNKEDISKNILDKFNQIHPKLKFTLETEINNTINYLDITIKRNNHNLQFSIFRKSTTSKLSINNNSCHPEQHKIANFRFLLHRLNTIPMSKKNYRIELNNILDIAEHNNYPMYKIHRLNRNIKNKLNTK